MIGRSLKRSNVSYLLGLPDELIQKGKDIKSISEIEHDGDNFKVTVTTGTKVLVNSFTIGKESELETITGEKLKVRGTLNLMSAPVTLEPQYIFSLYTLAYCHTVNYLLTFWEKMTYFLEAPSHTRKKIE